MRTPQDRNRAGVTVPANISELISCCGHNQSIATSSDTAFAATTARMTAAGGEEPSQASPTDVPGQVFGAADLRACLDTCIEDEDLKRIILETVRATFTCTPTA